jgi:hypothetical protein
MWYITRINDEAIEACGDGVQQLCDFVGLCYVAGWRPKRLELFLQERQHFVGCFLGDCSRIQDSLFFLPPVKPGSAEGRIVKEIQQRCNIATALQKLRVRVTQALQAS